MSALAKVMCATLLHGAFPVIAGASGPQEAEAVTVSPIVNLFADAVSLDGYAAKADDGELDLRLGELGFDLARGPLNVRVAYDFAGEGYWRDVGVFWKNNGRFIGIGQFKEPASLEKYTFQEDTPLAEPAGFTGAFNLSRRLGVVAGAYDTGWSLTAGAFSGSIDGTDAQGRGPGQTALTARATATVQAEGTRFHWGAYARRADYDGAGFYAASYPGSKLAAKTLHANFTSAAEDGLAERSFLSGLEFAWSRPGFHIQAEAARQDTSFAVRPDGEIWGGAVTASWILTGETRPYIKAKGVFSRIAPSNPVTDGGQGAWIATARIGLTDLTDVGLGRTVRTSAGLAWAATQAIRLEGEWTSEQGSAGAGDSDVLQLRLRLSY